MNWIDIHTHFDTVTPDVISVRNYIFGLENIESSTYFSVGVHPWYLHYSLDQFEHLLTDIRYNPRFVAVGECGMDFRKNYLKLFSKQLQQEIFIRQILQAENLQKPLIIHCVKCFNRLIYLKNSISTTIPWIVHGYSKNEILLNQLLEAGFYVSFGVHFFKSKRNRQALKSIPINRLFFETDEQDFFDIKTVYQKAAEVKQMDIQVLKKQIEKNFERIFLIKTV